MVGFVSYYIEANIVCAIAFAIMLIHNHFNIDRQEKQIKFDRVLGAFILYFIADCFWAAFTGGLIPGNRTAVVIDDFFLYIFMVAVTYAWLEYVLAFEQVPHRNRPINHFAVLFPFMVSTIAMVIQYFVAPQTLISDALETQTAYSVYLILVPDIYIVAILFYTIRRARTEENPAEKRNHIFIGALPLVIIIGGFVESVFFQQMPIYCVVCMLLMLVFYIQAIQRQVSLDPLTTLNNRGQLLRYTSQRTNIHQENRLTVVIMMDIDKFKEINDTYGHSEGDKALVIVADSLKSVANNHSMPSFLCRYGGDEFILIIHPEQRDMIRQIIREIQTAIENNTKAGQSLYELSVSIGYDELSGKDDPIQECIHRADEKLYEEKKRKKGLA